MEAQRAHRTGRRSFGPSRTRRSSRWSGTAAGWIAALIFGLAVGVPVAAVTGVDEPGPAEPGDEDGGEIELRAARAPEPEERARATRWNRDWQRETAPIEELLGSLGATDQPARVGNPDWCRALARSLLALDRDRVFPAPCGAADLYLRRAVDRLVRGAAACLEGRLHAAAYQIREAHGAFADAAAVLEPYGVRP